ncbi:MAG: leucine-rich repeat domain-containing protein [Prevotella sp.]|nr:leucine-rich repeat domain-containing protein [Prevotella sp.]
MKQIIKRGSFFTLMFLLLGCLSLYAADNDLITKQITIKLEKAGTLPDKIGSIKKYKITNLKIIGEINGTDLKMIRVMAGRDYIGYFTDGKLSVLDLSEAKIVEGGDCYYYINNHYNYYYYSTSNDVIGSYAFKGCNRLTSLTLPDGITEIGDHAFEGCSGLTSLNLPAGITKIGSEAFNGCSGLTSLNLSAGITEIGSEAFNGCSGLTSLNLPAGITKIGDDVFRGCSGLTSLTLPASITKIGDQAFHGCSGLKEVRFCINDNLDTYLTKGHPYIDVDCGIKYYINDKEITSIEIPSNVTTLGNYVFQGCSRLTSLTLPVGITSIGYRAFHDCSGLTSLILPAGAGITEIGSEAFEGCSGLTSLTLPAGITSIGSRAFQGCSGLTSIYVYAEKVPKIDSNVFEGVDAKKCTLYVPMGTRDDYWLSGFGDYFENIVEFEATGIDKITINLEKAGTLPDRIGKYYQITNLKIIGEINGTDLRMIREMARSGKLSVLDLSKAKIIEGGDCYYNDYYTSNDVIGSSAFQGCRGLTSLTLPAGITRIGSSAFAGCSGLTSLTLPAGIKWIGSSAFNGCSGLTSLTLPDGIVFIDSRAFCGCSGLTSLNLPAGITSIGDDTFQGCRGLTSLTLPAGITRIGSYAFLNCSGLTSLTLPASITSIGSWAFQGCSGLTSIYVCAEKVPEIGSSASAFWGFDAKKCTLYVPMGTRDDYRLSDFRYYFENIVEFEATEIDKITINLEKAGTLPDRIASSEKYKITNLKIIGEINGTDLRMIREMAKGNSIDGKLCVLDLSEAKIVEGGDWYYHENYNDNYYTHNDEIGGYAFHGCSGLRSLNLPAGITSIGSYAFRGCSGLTSLNLPAGITSIGRGAFLGCSGLTSLNLPAGIKWIGSSAFQGCSGLTSLNLPAGITKIGDDAFEGCKRLTSLNLPAGITVIDDNAFYGCSGLTSIYVYAEKVPEIGSNVFVGVGAKKCTLYVPMGTCDDYRLSKFGYFENIVEFDATGIDKTTTSTDVEEVARYSVNGQRLSAPTKGLNIVKYSDGSVKKVAVR